MITILAGDNDFEIDREAKELTTSFEGVAERVEASRLQPTDLPDLLMGTTLFGARRMVIIKHLSDNRIVWAALPDYILRIADDIHLVLIELRLDKRTKTYKMLQKHATIKEYSLWSERDAAKAERWTAREAQRLSIKLESTAARMIVDRSLLISEKGMATIDQWRLLSNLEKLASFGTVGKTEVERYIEETPVQNVFGLLEMALRGDAGQVKEMIGRCEVTEDPFRLFGLLSGQAFWLVVLAATDDPHQSVAKDFGANPFILGKLAPYARKLGMSGVKQVARVFAEADTAMKTSAADPWLLIERALLKAGQLPGSKNSAG